MFSATLRSGKSVGSWKMIAIPAACDCFAVSKIASSPSSTQPAGVRPVDAREDLHERGLAGAVLADEAVRLARVQLDPRVLERVDGAEPLVRVLQPEHRLDRGLLAQSRWKTSSSRTRPSSGRRPSRASKNPAISACQRAFTSVRSIAASAASKSSVST